MTATLPIAARRHELVGIIAQAMRQADVATDAVVIAAVSGGRDSMALLAALETMRGRDELGGVVVAHVHHHQRVEADDEARHVKATAERLGLPCAVHDLPDDPEAVPAVLRTRRYAALCAIARAWDSAVIATGHHAGDQLETVLLALTRGAGPRGLAGMPLVRPLEDGLRLVRPMLEATRAQAAGLCGVGELAWCDDPTNDDPGTARGRLRLEVRDTLEALGPGIEQRVAAGCVLQHAAADALDAAAIKPVDGVWARDALAACSQGLRLTSLHRALRGRGLASDACAADALHNAAVAVGDDKRHLRRFEVGGGVAIEVDAQSVRINDRG